MIGSATQFCGSMKVTDSHVYVCGKVFGHDGSCEQWVGRHFRYSWKRVFMDARFATKEEHETFDEKGRLCRKKECTVCEAREGEENEDIRVRSAR